MGNNLSQLFPPSPTFTEESLPDLSGKVFIVTGGSSGVGLEVVKRLYHKNGTVYIAARTERTALTLIDQIKAEYPESSGKLVFLYLELSDLSAVKQSATAFLAKEQRLDVLWNNAGLSKPDGRPKTAQGHEIHIGVNCLGPFLFTTLLLPILQKTAALARKDSVRVIWTASQSIDLLAPKHGLSVADLESSDKSPIINYTFSKTGNWFLGSELARRYGKDGIISVTQNPGNLRSNLQRDLTSWMTAILNHTILHDTRFGAYTELFAGLSPTITEAQNGAYIGPWGRMDNKRPTGMAASLKSKEEGGSGNAAEVWEWCERKIKEYM
ncbi:hypothetical protein AJ80_01558 [Polytolypa hystricis UAMH7299]|uniref:Short-chain dehydrogenase n=1 Tax=Polytolypa hystricis (strain UAMH7299) TaxID=1447883 RepID=A0A2B7Z134_POLH7|nr:hypothetical protein AJ80_01558 [Polytolypa hystricis UAMH7299]